MGKERMANPQPTPTPAPTPTPPPSPGPVDAYKCISNACVAAEGGVSLDTCAAICEGDSYKCKNNQCVVTVGGVSKDICEAVCGSDFTNLACQRFGSAGGLIFWASGSQ